MDLLLINGHIHTMNPRQPQVEALGIRGQRIAALGSTEALLAEKTSQTQVIDLKGQTVFPGFNDSHMHLLSYGYSLTMANLAGTDSLDALLNRARDFMDQQSIPPGTWVRGRGWNQDHFSDEKVFPTRYDLDRISTQHPICLTRTCGHVLVVNSKALEILGITRETPQFPGGHFDVDASGEPLGIFREDAMRVVYNAIPSPSTEAIKAMIVTASQALNACGITSVGSDDFEALPQSDYEKVIAAYQELAAEGQCTIRVYEQCLLSEKSRLQGFIDKGYVTGWGDQYFKIGPLKLLIDGSLGARTAALHQPYSDDPDNRGITTASQETLDELVAMAHNAGFQTAIHGIGDRGMSMAFEAIEKALANHPRKDHRHGIVHAQITNEALLDQFVALNALAYIQPIFLDYDWTIVRDRVGEEREQTSYNWKEMARRGIHAPCGSDAPVETFNVMQGIYEAVTRKDLQGNPAGGWLPQQALTPQEAVYGYTMEGAFATFEESEKGSLEVGKLADLAVVDKDPFDVSPDDIKDIQVTMTIFDGRVL